MGWFSKKADYPKWDGYGVSENYLTDDINAYLDPHFDMILHIVRNIIPRNHHNEAFVCGGFAAHMAGITTKHNDVDIFVPSSDVFKKLAARIQDDKDVVDRTDKREMLDISTKAYGRVLKFKFDDIKMDLVDLSDRVSRPTMMATLMEFDINWCMAGVNLGSDEIMIHKDALSSHLLINQDRADIYLEGTLDRIPKYAERLRKPVDMKEVDEMVEITKRRMVLRDKKEAKASRWY